MSSSRLYLNAAPRTISESVNIRGSRQTAMSV
ncbi:hypothetical protein AD23_5049, partial [Escherichia coli 2-005-03_S4_C3]